MKQIRPYPRVIVSKKAAQSLKAGHPWVFSGEVVGHEAAPTGDELTNGCVVDVCEQNGTWQGTGLFSEKSTIRVRIVTRNANDRVDHAFWERKLKWAWNYRKEVLGPQSLPQGSPDTTCCRLVFSEADALPGLVVDRYQDVLVTQIGSAGMELLRDELYETLLGLLLADGQDVCAVYERCDSPIREKEGLELRQGWWQPTSGAGVAAGVGTSAGEDTSRVVSEGDIRYVIDLEHGQKTGFFLDQKYNRRAVRRLSAGRRVLDCFSHVGGFGLNAIAGGACHARCVDISASAIEQAKTHAQLNDFVDRMSFSCTNVFDYLAELKASKSYLRDEGGPFDLIVLDPPAFTKSRSSIQSAARGYRQINSLAMKLLPRGAYLATCSCSHFMSTERFLSVVAQAAHDAGVQLRQVEARQQSPDHPIVVGIPETDYLKFFIFQLV